ncbi:hypothetical protein, partial [Noviherbaspirillum sp.]|uniref:hypothetical protein n=1 Tax=Noviherbaspirillum sp. TaxID=1926288 RepID=UPI002D307119
YRNDGVIDLFPSQGLGQSATLTTAQAQFIGNLEIATGLAPLNNDNPRDISEGSYDSNGVTFLIYTVLNDQQMTPVRFHLTAPEMMQVASYATTQEAVAVQVAKQGLSAEDQVLLDRLFNDPDIDENSIPPDALLRIEQAERAVHDYYSGLVLVGFQQAAAGTLDGWITVV